MQTNHYKPIMQTNYYLTRTYYEKYLHSYSYAFYFKLEKLILENNEIKEDSIIIKENMFLYEKFYEIDKEIESINLKKMWISIKKEIKKEIIENNPNQTIEFPKDDDVKDIRNFLNDEKNKEFLKKVKFLAPFLTTYLLSEIGRLTSLEHLRFSFDNLITLPPEIGKLTFLKELHLPRNKLISIPYTIGYLTSLTILNLRDNCLTSLPPEIGKLTSLKGIYLHRNKLKSLPPEIGKLGLLKSLLLYNNELETLPPEIANLSSVFCISVRNNKLKRLPPEIAKLSSLRLILLDNNDELTTLPSEFESLITSGCLSIEKEKIGKIVWNILRSKTSWIRCLYNYYYFDFSKITCDYRIEEDI